MGYQTVKQVPTLSSYAAAESWWASTKPIRGRNVELRPLAERRYADCYSIRKNPENNAIECVLYKTPVVTFMPDGEVQIRTSGWSTTSTHMFMREVLGWEVSARGANGKSAVTVNGSTFMLGRDSVLRLRRDDKSKYVIQNKQKHYDYRINRKAANKVRAGYKEFRDYLSSFIKLRGQMRPEVYQDDRFMVPCTMKELTEVLGSRPYYKNLNGPDSMMINTNEYTLGDTRHTHRTNEDEARRLQEFMGMIASGQPSEIKHERFYKAALVTLTANNNCFYLMGEESKVMWFSADAALKRLDVTLIKCHAGEVLDKVELPEGKVPNSKYSKWVKN